MIVLAGCEPSTADDTIANGVGALADTGGKAAVIGEVFLVLFAVFVVAVEPNGVGALVDIGG